MRVIHIMKDGSVRDSVEGCVIESHEFYAILSGILEEEEGDEK